MDNGTASRMRGPVAVSSPLNVSTIVARFAQLKQLTDRAKRLGELNQALLACIPSELVAHVQLATVRDDCVVIQAEGSTWAGQLRFKTPQILEKLKTHPEFREIRSIRVRNAPRLNPPPARPRAIMTDAGTLALRQQAHATTDERLRAALLRLARHGKGASE